MSLPQILTSYEQLSAELLRSTRVSKAESAQSPLLEILWHRIVLDEAQLIAGSSASAAEICSCLWRTASWVVTSTPCASIGELSGIFSFLDLGEKLFRCACAAALTSPQIPLPILKRLRRLWLTASKRAKLSLSV